MKEDTRPRIQRRRDLANSLHIPRRPPRMGVITQVAILTCRTSRRR
jgi:hypothetical protein